MVIGFDAKRVFHNSSGLGNYSRDIIRILAHQFADNRYLLYNPKMPRITRLKIESNTSVIYPDKWIWKKFSGFWRQRPVVKQIKRDGVDVYHGLSGEIPRGLHGAGVKSVVTIHDLIFIRFPELFNAIDRKIYFNKYHYAALQADVVIAISEQTKRDIVHFFGISEKKVQVHYQGCHPAFKKDFSASQKSALSKKLQLPDEYILNVGTIEKRKNVLLVLQAIQKLPYHLVLVGKPTDYKTELEKFVSENRMAHRVHFIEGLTMEELAMIYQMAALFCYPSIFEGFGIPIIEALYSGTPVIASKGSCFAEAGGPDSVYLGNQDVSAWKTEIGKLMESPQQRGTMAEAGRRFVQKFNDENVGNGLMDIYRNLVSS